MMAMKRTMVVLGVALAGALMSASAQVRVSFTHLKSVDLSSYFPTGGQQGDLASDVAFDGANLYIAGMSTANSLAEPVGVLKISNALSLDVNAWGYTPLITLTQAGQSRSSYIVYRDGSCIWARGWVTAAMWRLERASASTMRRQARKCQAGTSQASCCRAT
jgi:hypothetical protein